MDQNDKGSQKSDATLTPEQYDALIQQIIDRQNRQKDNQNIDKVIQSRFRATQTHHTATKNPIEIQKNLRFPLNLIGKLYMKSKNHDGTEPEVPVGSCLLISKNLLLASLHQLNSYGDGKQYELFVKIKDVPLLRVANPNLKQQRLQKGLNLKNDYIFLKMQLDNSGEAVDKLFQQKQIIFSCLPQLPTKKMYNISFNGTVYGFIKETPDHIKLSQEYYTDLCFSTSKMFYDGQSLQYNACTYNGMSGGIIAVEDTNSDIIVVGMHISGNQYKQNNKGLPFTPSFIQQLKKQNSSFSNKPINLKSTKNLITYQVSLQQKLLQLKHKSLQQRLQVVGQIMKGLLNQLQKLQINKIFINTLSETNVIISQEIDTYMKPSEKKLIKSVHLCDLQLTFQCFPFRKSKRQNLQCLRQFLKSNTEIKNIISEFNMQKEKKIKKHAKTFIMINRILQSKEITSIYNIKSLFYYQRMSSPTSQSATQIINDQEQKKFFLKYFKMDSYQLQNQKKRKQRFQFLFRYSNKMLNKFGFLRIFMVTIMELFSNIKNRLTKIECLTNSRKHLKKLKQLNIEINLAKNFLKSLDQDSYIYSGFQTQKQRILHDIANYEKVYIKQIYQCLEQYLIYLGKLMENQGQYLFKNYKNLPKKLPLQQIIIQFSLYNSKFDGIPQNANRGKINNSKYKTFFKNFQLFNIFQAKQTSSYVYSISSLKKSQLPRYIKIIQLLVQIKDQNDKILGTGFLISKNLICTALHVFQKGCGFQNQNDFLSAVKKCKVKFIYKGQYNCIDAFPKVIKKKQQRKLHEDIAIIRIKSQFGQKLSIMNYGQRQVKKQEIKQEINKQQNIQRLFATIIGYGKSAYTQKKIVLKKTIGQIQLNRQSNIIRLKADHILSGSPFLINTTTTDSIASSIYTGLIGQNFGKVCQFNRNNFPELKEEFQKKQIQITDYSNYDKFLDIQLLKQYIQRQYGTIDHFVLRVMAQILKLNHYNFYLRQLTIDNLIINRNNNLNILFTNLQLVKKEDIVIHEERLQSKRDSMLLIIEQCEKINLQAFYGFIVYVFQKISKSKFLLDTVGDKLSNKKIFTEKYKTLNQFAKNVDQNYIVKEKTVRREDNTILNYTLQSSWPPMTRIRNLISFDYYDIQERHFIRKIQQRIQKLEVAFFLLKYPTDSNSPWKLINNKYKLVNIKRVVRNRFHQLKIMLPEITNQNQIDHFDFLAQILINKFKTIKELLNLQYDITKKLKNFEKALDSYLKMTSLDVKTVKEFKYYEKQQFEQTYLIIRKWKMIEDLIEQIACLSMLRQSQDNQTVNKGNQEEVGIEDVEQLYKNA